jgi:uncharacterized membrane protein YfcA
VEIGVLILTGFVGGLIAGLLGLGGGIFYIVVLPYVFRWYGLAVDDSSAYVISNSLFGITIASGISIFTDIKKLKLYLNESLILAVPAVFISLFATKYIVQSSKYSFDTFNMLVIGFLLFILFQMRIKRPDPDSSISLRLFPTSFYGAASGFVSALSGLGGGIIIIPLLQIIFKQKVNKAKLISLVVIFLSSLTMTIFNMVSQTEKIASHSIQWGYILPFIVFPISLGVLIGGPLGVKLSYILNAKNLKLLFSLVVALVLLEKLMYYF